MQQTYETFRFTFVLLFFYPVELSSGADSMAVAPESAKLENPDVK
jgi:hypothetical protein